MQTPLSLSHSTITLLVDAGSPPPSPRHPSPNPSPEPPPPLTDRVNKKGSAGEGVGVEGRVLVSISGIIRYSTLSADCIINSRVASYFKWVFTVRRTLKQVKTGQFSNSRVYLCMIGPLCQTAASYVRFMFDFKQLDCWFSECRQLYDMVQ